jgi:hypothetical protein
VDAVHLSDLVAEIGKLFHRTLRAIGVVPESFVAGTQIELANRSLFSSVVKDAP